MAGAVLAGGIGLLLLVFAATVLSIAFATRAAMATNRPVIEVPSSAPGQKPTRSTPAPSISAAGIGGRADRPEQRHCTVCARRTHQRPARRHGEGDQFTALFGSSSIGALGYLAVLAQVGLIAFVVTPLPYREPHDRNDLLGKLTTSCVATALPDFAIYCEVDETCRRSDQYRRWRR